MIAIRIDIHKRGGERAVRIRKAVQQRSQVSRISFVFDFVLGQRQFNSVTLGPDGGLFCEPALLHASRDGNADQQSDKECNDRRREQSAARVFETTESRRLLQYGAIKL